MFGSGKKKKRIKTQSSSTRTSLGFLLGVHTWIEGVHEHPAHIKKFKNVNSMYIFLPGVQVSSDFQMGS